MIQVLPLRNNNLLKFIKGPKEVKDQKGRPFVNGTHDVLSYSKVFIKCLPHAKPYSSES